MLTNPSLLDTYAFPAENQPVVTALTYTGDLQDQPRNAFDGAAATAWIASPADPHPKLKISWGSAWSAGSPSSARQARQG